MAMLLEREEEEEMKRRGEDSSTEKWPWTVRETWAAERCLCGAPLSWRGYDSIRYDRETCVGGAFIFRCSVWGCARFTDRFRVATAG